MRLIIPRGPDHPIPLEQWKEFRETVGECQRKMEALLDLAEEDPLMTLLRELTETLGQYTPHAPSPIYRATAVPGRPSKKEEEAPSEQPQ